MYLTSLFMNVIITTYLGGNMAYITETESFHIRQQMDKLTKKVETLTEDNKDLNRKINRMMLLMYSSAMRELLNRHADLLTQRELLITISLLRGKDARAEANEEYQRSLGVALSSFMSTFRDCEPYLSARNKMDAESTYQRILSELTNKKGLPSHLTTSTSASANFGL